MTVESSLPSSPAPRPARESHPFWPLVVALLLGCALPVLSCMALMVTSALSLQLLTLGRSTSAPGIGGGGTGPAVAVIRVNGVLVSGRSTAFDTSTAASDNVIDEINQAKQDASVKAIVLMVNSPGGSVTASDLIYRALKNAGKPVVVMMGETAASGGYYISMAGEWIVANPTSLTGSIGVISEFPNASGLLQKVGVDFVVITSGPRKDIGSPYREMTEAEHHRHQAPVDRARGAEGHHRPVGQGADPHVAGGEVAVGVRHPDDGLVEVAVAEAHGAQHRAVGGPLVALGDGAAAAGVGHCSSSVPSILIRPCYPRGRPR